LGLSVTYGIIQKLGGTLRVQSEYGKGTLFTVELPINADG
jgi:two-component system NtrC family sensor kinase